jgi:hypothetical protein
MSKSFNAPVYVNVPLFSVTQELAAAFRGIARVLTSIVPSAYWLDASSAVSYRLGNEHRANKWLRLLGVHPTGRPVRHHVHEKSIQRSVQIAIRKAGIIQPASCHTFRHCFYTHVLGKGAMGVKSPLDRPIAEI